MCYHLSTDYHMATHVEQRLDAVTYIFPKQRLKYIPYRHGIYQIGISALLRHALAMVDDVFSLRFMCFTLSRKAMTMMKSSRWKPSMFEWNTISHTHFYRVWQKLMNVRQCLSTCSVLFRYQRVLWLLVKIKNELHDFCILMYGIQKFCLTLQI